MDFLYLSLFHLFVLLWKFWRIVESYCTCMCTISISDDTNLLILNVLPLFSFTCYTPMGQFACCFGYLRAFGVTIWTSRAFVPVFWTSPSLLRRSCAHCCLPLLPFRSLWCPSLTWEEFCPPTIRGSPLSLNGLSVGTQQRWTEQRMWYGLRVQGANFLSTSSRIRQDGGYLRPLVSAITRCWNYRDTHATAGYQVLVYACLY